MAISYGKYSAIVTPDMIENIIVDSGGTTTYTIDRDSNNSAIIKFDIIGGGCGSNKGMSIQIGDSVISWSKIYMRFFTDGVASCWGWNGNNGYGAGMTSSERQGNLMSFNENLGDYTKNEFNVWDLPQFDRRFSACNNNSNNYMHVSFALPTRGFDVYTRRNNMNIPAGPSHGRSCNSGTGTLIVSKMRIME